MQDDIYVGEVMFLDVFRDALHGSVRRPAAHPLWQRPPALLCHLVDVAVGTGQVATTMHLENELPERCGLMTGSEHRWHIERQQRPGGGMRAIGRREVRGDMAVGGSQRQLEA